jgi:hypothetical protein
LPLPTTKKHVALSRRHWPSRRRFATQPEAAATTCADHARKVFGDLQSRQWTTMIK